MAFYLKKDLFTATYFPPFIHCINLSFSEEQIKSLAPTPAAFNAGKKLGVVTNWDVCAKSDRALWGEIKGSGKKPYLTQIDFQSLAYKCSCPSRQFPCKHAIGLMLLYGKNGSDFHISNEPEWVSTWMNNRQAREKKQAQTPKEPTEEAQQSAEKSAQETISKRLELVIAGAQELELWLKDLIRIGLLELPTKPKGEFNKVAARMIDAKAPGLAGWVRTLSNLDYHEAKSWHDQSMQIIAKLFLLIQAIKNYHQLDESWQTTVRTLAGWNQSGKELLASTKAEIISDHWLVIGQHEEINEDLTTQRSWLIGKHTNRKALILNFSTKFSQYETIMLPGKFIDAKLAFFPSVLPHRAVIKAQREASQPLDGGFEFTEDWTQVHYLKLQNLKVNPWLNDHVFLIKNVRIIRNDETWAVLDTANQSANLTPTFTLENGLKWLSISGNAPVNLAFVLRNDQVMPLGIFHQNEYILL